MSRAPRKPTRRPPAFQFYPRDFLADRAVAAMLPIERGGYVMLLCHAWLSDRPGWLPDDDPLLAALSGLHSQWHDHRDGVARAFTVRKGWWVQKRMVREFRAFASYSRSQKSRAKSRWNKASDMPPHQSGINPAVPNACSAPASAPASAYVEEPPTPPTPEGLPTLPLARDPSRALRAGDETLEQPAWRKRRP